MTKFHGSRWMIALALTGSLLLAGCGSKVNKDNFAKIKNGMTQQEVEAILGSGTVTDAGGAGAGGVSISGKSEVWKDGSKTINVAYLNDKVIASKSDGL